MPQKIPEVQSKEFTVSKLHFQVTNLQKMKVWFGEDLKKSNDFNNAGRVCADVYAILRGNVSHFLKKKTPFVITLVWDQVSYLQKRLIHLSK